MEGRVKTFSQEKGYGFLTDQNGTLRYFSASEIQGNEIPIEGTAVEFISTDEGARVVNIEITKSICVTCRIEIAPKVVWGRPFETVNNSPEYTPVPKRTKCPSCGETQEKFHMSKIERLNATLVYGTIAFFFVGMFAVVFLLE